jgi:hypothetical protein
MYRANLSFKQLNDHTGLLIDRGLLEVRNDGSYWATSKGSEYLDVYGKLESLLQKEEPLSIQSLIISNGNGVYTKKRNHAYAKNS